MEEQDVTSRLQADNGRLAEDNARLRAQLLAATTGNPQDEQFVVVARESLTRWSAQLREGCADNESGCCTECGAYLASMPHLDDCSWVPLTDEIDRHAAIQPMAPDIPAAQLDCSLARVRTLRSMGLNATENSQLVPVWNEAWKAAVRACAISGGPDVLTAEEWVKLRNWAQIDEREPAKTAFTAGAARDAASAFEAAFHADPLLARPSVTSALREAVAVLYLSDNSDYRGALWNIVRSLSPRMWQLLQDNESAAYRAVHAMDRSAIEREQAFSAEDASRWQYIVDNSYCEVQYRDRAEHQTVQITVFLGRLNPLPFTEPDPHGHIRLTPGLIDAAILRGKIATD